jgi:hypothetical protein
MQNEYSYGPRVVQRYASTHGAERHRSLRRGVPFVPRNRVTSERGTTDCRWAGWTASLSGLATGGSELAPLLAS